MFQMQTAGSKRVHVTSFLILLGVITTALAVWAGTGLTRKIISERQAALVAVLRKNVADSPAFLVERLRDLQSRNIFLFVPGMLKPVSFPVGLFSFDPKAFPESFLSGLVYEVEHGSPVYHLKLREVRETREIEILNADGKVFYVFKPSYDYDPRWLARLKRPQIYAASFPAAQRATDEEELDPSHVEMEVTLIPDDYVEAYAEGRLASLYDVLLAEESTPVQKTSLSGGMTMMRSLQAASNIVFESISRASTGATLVTAGEWSGTGLGFAMGGAGVVKGVAKAGSQSLRKQLYEIGQKTLTKGEFDYFAARNADPVRRGIDIVRQQGWLRAKLPSPAGLLTQSWRTIGTGLTPLAAEEFGSALMMGYGLGVGAYGAYESGDCK